MITNKWAFAQLLILACFAGLGSSQAQTGEESSPLRVLTYNIHHGEGVDAQLDLDRVARIVNQSSADLIALQEVDRKTERSGTRDQVLELSELTNRHPAFAKFMDYQGGEYGLAILSRWPIEQSWDIALPPGRLEPRSALAVRVAHPTLGRITFVCLHFDWLDEDEERFAQSRALLAALRGQEGIVILAGDVNDIPESRTLRLLSSQFANVRKTSDAGSTFPAADPDREIDFVLYRSPTQVNARARVLQELVASDHRPVLAELEFTTLSQPPGR